MANVLPRSIHDIDSSITQLQHVLSILPRSHPRRPPCALSLGLSQLKRYTLSNQREDLDKATSHLTESILLQPLSWLRHGSFFLQALSELASALLVRSKVSNQPEDAVYAAKYLRHLRDQPCVISHIPPLRITTMLVDALSFQVELETGNMMQNIREMVDLCHEHLTSGLDTSVVHTTVLILLISDIVMSKIHMFSPDENLDKLIECLQAARKNRPDLIEGRIALAGSLFVRYFMTSVNDAYEEAMSILDEIITSSNSPGDSQDESLATVQSLATWMLPMLAKLRSIAHQTPEYLEEAIYRTHASLGSTSAKATSVPFDTENIAELRFSFFGSIERVEASSSISPSPLTEDDENVRRIDKMNSILSAIRNNDDTTKTDISPSQLTEDDANIRRIEKMNSLLFAIRNNDETTKIEEAIDKARTILTSSSSLRFQTHPFKAVLFDSFGSILQEAFLRTRNIEYLNESISAYRHITEHPRLQSAHTLISAKIIRSLFLRFAYFRTLGHHRTQDLNEALGLLSQCVSDARGYLPDRFSFACIWAGWARRFQHPTITTAYETAMSLRQDTLHVPPTLQLQHNTLATHVHTHSMPLDYASHQVDLGQLEEAIETLERGRALLWSEMRHFHISIDQLLETDPDIGPKFAAVNRDLEELTKSVPPSHKLSIDDGADGELRAVDPFGRLVLKKSQLLKLRDELVSQIQLLPGFDEFMTSPSFDTLRSAASSGPVVIINHSRWRSDILILLHDASPSLVPTSPDFYMRARALKDNLLDSRRKYGLDSNHYDEALASVLAELYTLVGKPVIDRLRQLQVPEQSRIWWCPTSVFCSLPLHAMGPIPSDDGEPRYFLDLYICSYTPTLSALIQSRNRDSGSLSSDRPSILLVAQPDPSLPTVGGEIQVVQALDTKVTSLISATATRAAVTDGFNHHGCVHFACHGTLELGKPFEVGFELYGGERLTLLDIVRSRLPTAEFAFLSACHTAEVTEGSIIDEGLHLAAAVQYCGFRSVVGTMWAMADVDGRDLAENFYKALFSNSRGIPYHERSARALRVAVKKLRRKRQITLERWVNFVHYGA